MCSKWAKHISKTNERRRGTGEERSPGVQGEAKWMKREDLDERVKNIEERDKNIFLPPSPM